ncbi:hypothetical protein QBC38DRAFT_246396 [Podospora fimiseda]|uniref:Uncharacterized protein n=1 Tax=Podospora fimiseda TaxID=252190 RepID=A0AAN7BX96_9PEZI|nr:hypothetical protein QBC38DRAFT_246396 [Podospora fimiseda]
MPTIWLSDSQKIGVAFCSGGGFFLIGGVMLFFDRAMLAMGNVRSLSFCPGPEIPLQQLTLIPPFPQILFLIGLTIIIGPSKTALFFARKQKLQGTLAFFAGLLLILFRWPLIGFLIELYGIMILFGDFLGTIAGFARNIPVVGPYIGMAVDRTGLGSSRSNSQLPV